MWKSLAVDSWMISGFLAYLFGLFPPPMISVHLAYRPTFGWSGCKNITHSLFTLSYFFLCSHIFCFCALMIHSPFFSQSLGILLFFFFLEFAPTQSVPFLRGKESFSPGPGSNRRVWSPVSLLLATPLLLWWWNVDKSGGHVLLFGLPLCKDRLGMAPVSAYEPCDSLVDYVPYAVTRTDCCSLDIRWYSSLVRVGIVSVLMILWISL